MPLELGNYWVWNQSVINAEGETTFSELDSLRIIEKDSVEGNLWYLASNWYYYVEKDDGLWWRKGTQVAPSRLYKSPVVAGDTYSIIDNFGKTVYYDVLSTANEITVPAGSFSCWQFHLYCPACGITDTVWIAPDLGEIRTVALLEDGSRHERELLRYRLN